MTKQREEIIRWIDEARKAGARQSKACEVIVICAKKLQRWSKPDNLQDGRLDRQLEPINKLTELDLKRIIKVANEQVYAQLPPSKIVLKLADHEHYLSSESTFNRVIKVNNQLNHQQKTRPSEQQKRPKALTTSAPNQLYTRDITYQPSQIKGLFFYLYVVMDIFNCKIVGWQVDEEECNVLAADLMTDICLRKGVERNMVTLHCDNGGATMLATLQELDVAPSFSRPSISNDNPYSRSLFRKLKYHHEYPEKPFANLEVTRTWVQGFVDWYNHQHSHNTIKFVTPEQRHTASDIEMLAHHTQVYQQAKLAHPEGWSREIRNWDRVGEVFLNSVKQIKEKQIKVKQIKVKQIKVKQIKVKQIKEKKVNKAA